MGASSHHHTNQLLAVAALTALVAAPICCHQMNRPATCPAPGGPTTAPATRPSVASPVAVEAGSTNGERNSVSAPAHSTSQPAAKMVPFDGAKQGFTLGYPSDWKPKSNPDYVLALVPATRPAGPMITFDVPNLPPHLPWMISLNKIEHGYVDDLRKSHPDLKIESAADHPVAGAKARLVRLTWAEGKATHTHLGLLMMHSNGVYLLSADADAPRLPATRQAFDRISSSIQWAK